MLTSWRHGLEKFWNDGQKLFSVLWVAPSSTGDCASAVDNEMLRPSIRVLQQATKSLLVLGSGPTVEGLGTRVLHDEVHKILVSLEGVAESHQWENLLAFTDPDASRELVAVAVFTLSEDEEITRDFVGLDPDVGGAHDLPCVDWAEFLVQLSEMPC